MKLFHVSEAKNIAEFVPRYSQHIQNSVVWAIAESKLANYLLPRNCPRVCFSVGNQTSEVERRHFLGSSKQVVAIEASWYEKAISTTLYLYEMPDITFELYDAIAEYYIADTTVVPVRQHIVYQPIEELLSYYPKILNFGSYRLYGNYTMRWLIQL